MSYTDDSDGSLAGRRARGAAEAFELLYRPRDHHEALLLQIESELSVEEIASITNGSQETIKTRLRLARTTLRELLNE